MSKNEEILSNESLLRALVSCEQNKISPLKNENWEPLVSHGSVTAIRSAAGGDGLFAYVLLGELELTPEQLVAVNIDLDYRNTWDEFAKTLKTVENVDKHTSVVYWRVAYPWPMAHRDYVYYRLFQEICEDELLEQLPEGELRAQLMSLVAGKNNNVSGKRKWWVMASKPTEHANDPTKAMKEKDRPVRVKPFDGVTVITQSENGADKVQFFSYLYENPGGAIPK